MRKHLGYLCGPVLKNSVVFAVFSSVESRLVSHTNFFDTTYGYKTLINSA